MRKTTPQQARIRTFLILGVGLFLALLGVARGEQVPLIVLGLAVMFSSVLHHVIFYRCPHCGKFLDRSSGAFCPGCGRRIDGKEDPPR